MSDQVIAAIIGGGATLAAGTLAVWLRHVLQNRDKVASRDGYGIKLISPSDGAVVADSVEVAGTYDVRPPADSFFIVHGAIEGAYYWPQVGSSVEFDTSKKAWRGKMWISNDVRVFAVTVGPAGRAMFRYYEKVGEATGQWPAIEDLPDDVVRQGNAITVRCRGN
jgi:hypothetical protein